jgi:crossover junction endodeoxyribonuclease RusA
MAVVTLPYPPSANQYWRLFKGRIVVTRETKAYRAAVRLAWLGLKPRVFALSGPVCLIVDLYRPRRAGDLSNRIKVLEDALQGLAYLDDKQVTYLRATRYEGTPPGKAVVTIEAYAEADESHHMGGD